MAKRILTQLFIGIGLLVSAQAQAQTEASNDEPKLCDFARVKLKSSSLQQPEVRARLAALDWVRYNHVANTSIKNIKELGRSNQTDRGTLLFGGLVLMANLEGQSKRLHLHSCFSKAFESDEIYSQHFKGNNLSRSKSDAKILYAVVEPQDKRQPVFIVTPSTSYNYYPRTSELTTFDNETESYVAVDPRSRRWVEHIIQDHFDKVRNK